MTLAYPEDSLQSLLLPSLWWVTANEAEIRRGRLIRAFIPHVDQEPRTLIPEGRKEATSHEGALFRIEPLKIARPSRRTTLPVAALPTYPGEVHIVQRAKVRPALILSTGGTDVPRSLRVGAAPYQTTPTILVAPYYGADPGGTRGGWRPEFVQRIRRCEYPQYFYDRLPIGGPDESILRIDHVQPIGRHADSIELAPFSLSDDALQIVDDWLAWYFNGDLPPESILAQIRKYLLAIA